VKDTKLTVGEGADLLVKAEAARQEHAVLQAYLQRGRAFKDLSDEDLRERWIETCREWARKGMYDRPVAHDDADAELKLRGLPAPYDRVQDEMNALRAEADARLKQATPEEHRRMGEQLVARYVDQRDQEN
jgi:hypothetical protein